MKKSIFKDKRGFTLIELIVVIAILGIISSISVPKFVGFIQSAKISADQATVVTLNKATDILRMTLSGYDSFLDKGKDSQYLMKKLLTDGYLSSEPEPQSKDADFHWNFDKETWSLMFKDSFYEIAMSEGFEFMGSIGRLAGGYTGQAKDIFIPVSINETEITGIYQDLFKNRDLVSVNIDKDSKIKQIHARAFRKNQLTNIDFPDSVERIDFWAFSDNNFTQVKLPPNLHTIESKAFEGNDITEITIGGSVTTIGDKVFGNNTKDFKDAYASYGAGTYVLIDGNWVLK